jgi:hypothetical protein
MGYFNKFLSYRLEVLFMGLALTTKWWARALGRQIGVVLPICGMSLLFGQPQKQDQPPSPVFKVNVVSKSTKAINYRHRSGSTTINFVGTALMPKAKDKPESTAVRARSVSMPPSKQ